MTVPITALEFSRDGSAIAASGYHEITFWKTADGTLDRRLTGLAERIYDIAYSPDGKWMATASGDPGVYRRRQALGWPSRAAAASRSATSSRPRTSSSRSLSAPTARRSPPPAPTGPSAIFEVETGKLLTQIEDHADWIFAVAFSPDGKRLASASRDKTSKVFDVEKKESLVTFPGHAQPVYTVSFTPDGKGVATGGEDNRIRDLEPRQRRQVDPRDRRLRRHGFQAAVFARRPDARRVQRRQDGPPVQGQRVLAPQAAGTQDWIYSLAISPTARPSPREAGTARSGSGTSPTASCIRNIIAAPGYKPADRERPRLGDRWEGQSNHE